MQRSSSASPLIGVHYGNQLLRAVRTTAPTEQAGIEFFERMASLAVVPLPTSSMRVALTSVPASGPNGERQLPCGKCRQRFTIGMKTAEEAVRAAKAAGRDCLYLDHRGFRLSVSGGKPRS